MPTTTRTALTHTAVRDYFLYAPLAEARVAMDYCTEALKGRTRTPRKVKTRKKEKETVETGTSRAASVTTPVAS